MEATIPGLASTPVSCAEVASALMSMVDLIDADLVTRRVCLRAEDVVFAKGILEASEGVGVLFGERGGEVIIAAPKSRAVELDLLLADLKQEIDAVMEAAAGSPVGTDIEDQNGGSQQ